MTTRVKYSTVEEQRTTLSVGVTRFSDDVRMGTTACRAALPTCRARERPLVSCGSAHDGRHRAGDGSECCRPPGCREPGAHYQSRAREGHARAGHGFPARSPRSAPARADLLRRLSERTSDLPAFVSAMQTLIAGCAPGRTSSKTNSTYELQGLLEMSRDVSRTRRRFRVHAVRTLATPCRRAATPVDSAARRLACAEERTHPS